MKLKSRILGSSMVAVLALGMSAAPTFGVAASNPPQATVPYDAGSMQDRGTCTGLLIGSLADPTKLAGLTNQLKDITSSSKGVPGSAAEAALLRVGACFLDGRLGVSGVPSGNGTDVKYVTKAGTKLHSVGTSCGSDKNGNGIPREPAQYVSQQIPVGLSIPNGGTVVVTTAAVGGDWQPAQRALTGKIGYSYSDLTKTDGYIRVQGFDEEPTIGASIVWLTGMVTKGEALGSTIAGNVWFNPVFKAKLATTYFDVSTAADFTDPIFGASRSYAPGYGGNTGYGLISAGGCLDPSAVMVPGIMGIAIGGGSTDPLLGLTSAGIKFLL